MADKIDKRTRVLLVKLGRHLRRTRETLGVSQKDLSRKTGIEAPNLSRIEHGEKNVTMDTLVRIADGLDVELIVRTRRHAK